MQVKTMVSAGLLALSGAAIAQVTTQSDPKLGNASNAANAQAGADASASDNAANNASDPGKR